MNKRKLFPVFILVALLLFLEGFYVFYLRSLVELAYVGNAPEWFTKLVYTFYPRFEVERHRFDLSFFQQKADQILIRIFLIGILILFSIYFYYTSEAIKNWFRNFWNTRTSIRNVSVLRILFYALMLFIFKDIYWDLLTWKKAEIFYKPILALRPFVSSFPSENVILIIYLILIISCVACIFNFYSVVFSVVAIADFVFIQALIFGFEKTDHGFAPFTYAGLVMPFLLYNYNVSKKAGNSDMEAWPLQLILTLISICYLFSGLEKILISNFQWANPQTFKAYLMLHQTKFGMQLIDHHFICTLLPLLTLLFQLGFISVLLYKKSRWIFIPSAIVFHFSTYLLFNVGGFTNPWILVLIFFIEWDRLIKQKTIELGMV